MSANRFVAVDVETANYRFASICQIGAALFEDGELINEWETLVDPGGEFEDFHTRLHGICAADVSSAPRFHDAFRQFKTFTGDNLIVSYGHFDRSAFSQACAAGGIPLLENPWINIQSVVKRAWPDRYGNGGFRLNMVAKFLGIPLHRHHNALDDARAAGAVFAQACAVSGVAAADWAAAVKRPIYSATRPDVKAVVNLNGILYGECVTFTGALSLPRRQAQAMAAAVGCTPLPGVTKKTTLLVVGDQDLSKLQGKEKSSKHLKAEQLIAGGQQIRIIGESDFMAMVLLEGEAPGGAYA